jgi:hypothetical protein
MVQRSGNEDWELGTVVAGGGAASGFFPDRLRRFLAGAGRQQQYELHAFKQWQYRHGPEYDRLLDDNRDASELVHGDGRAELRGHQLSFESYKSQLQFIFDVGVDQRHNGGDVYAYGDDCVRYDAWGLHDYSDGQFWQPFGLYSGVRRGVDRRDCDVQHYVDDERGFLYLERRD